MRCRPLNSARRRRIQIRKRAGIALGVRARKLCKHGGIFGGEFCKKCHPPKVEVARAPMFRAYAFLKESSSYKVDWIPVDIPVKDAYRTIHRMQYEGFWVPWPGQPDKEGKERPVGLAFIQPGQIRRVVIWPQDNGI